MTCHVQAAERIRQPFLALMLAHSGREHEPMWEQVRILQVHSLLSLPFQLARLQQATQDWFQHSSLQPYG